MVILLIIHNIVQQTLDSQLSTPTYLFSILSLISLFRYIATMFYQSYTNSTSTVYVGNKQTGRGGGENGTALPVLLYLVLYLYMFANSQLYVHNKITMSYCNS